MKTIAFAIVIAACLFSPTKHDCLLGWSIFGLWFAALCEDELGHVGKHFREGR